MIFGLDEAPASARVTYHAQVLALLSAKEVPSMELTEVKRALDEAFLHLTKENTHGN